MAKFYDRHRGAPTEYKVGDMVWLDGKDLKTDRPSKKLEDKRYGPYKITKVVGSNAYELKLPPTMKIHPVFNVVKLMPHHPDPVGRKAPSRSPPVIKGVSGFPLFLCIFPYLFRIFPFYICVDILSVLFVCVRQDT